MSKLPEYTAAKLAQALLDAAQMANESDIASELQRLANSLLSLSDEPEMDQRQS